MPPFEAIQSLIKSQKRKIQFNSKQNKNQKEKIV